jgi:twinkle protein
MTPTAKKTAHDQFKPFNGFIGKLLDRMFPEDSGKLAGFGLPWEKCSAIKFQPGELSVWSGINGHGKSLFLSQMMLEAMSQKERVLIASFEMRPERTAERMVRQLLTYQTDDINEVVESMEWLSKRGLVNVDTGQMSANELLSYMTEFAKEGVNQFVVDSLMKVGIDQDDYNGMARFTNQLVTLAQRFNVHVHLVAHSKKQIDEDGAPGKMDVKGPTEITNLPDWVFTLWRNKAKEKVMWEYQNTRNLPKGKTLLDIQDTPDAFFICDKSRDRGEEAEKRYGLFFHRESMQYVDRRNHEPKNYINL